MVKNSHFAAARGGKGRKRVKNMVFRTSRTLRGVSRNLRRAAREVRRASRKVRADAPNFRADARDLGEAPRNLRATARTVRGAAPKVRATAPGLRTACRDRERNRGKRNRTGRNAAPSGSRNPQHLGQASLHRTRLI
jgi:hypothetical protein